MLNELYALSETLRKQRIQTSAWHGDYKELPGSPCCRIWLGSDGSIRRVEIIDKALAKNCRKYGNNQQAFPAFNIAPLFRITAGDEKDYFDKLLKQEAPFDLDRLKAMCTSDNWLKGLLNKASGCLHKRIPSMPDDSAIAALMTITASLDGQAFRKNLEACVWHQLEEDVPTCLPILLHRGNPSKEPTKDSGSLSVILDIEEWKKYGNPIASAHTTDQINAWLNQEAGKTATQSDTRDAFGAPSVILNQTMPRVRLRPGFDVALRSMFHEQACQYRYGHAEDASFPVSLANRTAMKSSLEWLVHADRENQTWRVLDEKAIVFIYPDKLPEIPIQLSALFAGGTENGTPALRFAQIVEGITGTLDGLVPKQRPEKAHVFVLQQIPPSMSNRAKVVFTRQLTMASLIASAESWQRGCENLPAMNDVEYVVPFPLHVSKIVNKVWKRNGERVDDKKSTDTKVRKPKDNQADKKKGANVMQYYQGLELLLDAPEKMYLKRLLHAITAQSQGLILFLGNTRPRRNPTLEMKKKLPACAEEMRQLGPLLGLLLYKNDTKKEDYMEDTGYLVGQVLKISDELHILYCEFKRNGDVPPQLVGNSVLVTASETPVQALAVLCTRMAPYITWAKQYRAQKQEKSALVAWHLRNYETIMSKLQPLFTENRRFHDLDKAQLFIGYLAALPKAESAQSTEKEILRDEH